MKNMLIRTSASAQRAAPDSVSGHQPTSATDHQPAGRRCLRAAKRLLVSRCISAKSPRAHAVHHPPHHGLMARPLIKEGIQYVFESLIATPTALEAAQEMQPASRWIVCRDALLHPHNRHVSLSGFDNNSPVRVRVSECFL